MTMNDEQATGSWGRMVLLVLAALLALIIPFVLVTRVLDAGNNGAAPGVTTSRSSGSRLPAMSVSTTAVGSTVATVSTVSDTTTSTSGAPSPLAGASEACRLTNLRQQTALSAAQVSMEQFQKHIDAMNLLVTGKISLPVARTFWNQTRVQAQEKADAFRAADKALSNSKASCPELGPTAACSAPIKEVNAITACAKASIARQTVLVRARSAVTTWEHHIHDMEMLRLGHITAAQAADKWIKTWKKGQGQVDSYSAAVLLSDNLQCPLS